MVRESNTQKVASRQRRKPLLLAPRNSTSTTRQALYFEPNDVSFADYLDFFYERYVLHETKPNTQISYKTIINKVLTNIWHIQIAGNNTYRLSRMAKSIDKVRLSGRNHQ